MADLNREQLDAGLWKMVRDAQAYAFRARDDIDRSPVCTSAFGDYAACRALHANAVDCDAKILALATKVGSITSRDTKDIREDELEDVRVEVGLIRDLLTSLLDYSDDVGTWHEYAVEVIRQFVEVVREAVGAVVDVAGDIGGAIVQGFWEGIGPIGQLLVLWGFYELVIHRKTIAKGAAHVAGHVAKRAAGIP